MRRHALPALLVVAVAACANRAKPPDTTLEETVPTASTVDRDPRELRVVTFNVHRETPEKVIEGITKDRALRDADVFVLQEVHRVEKPGVTRCSPACVLGKQLGYYSIYAPGHMQGNGSDGVAIVSRLPLTSAQVIELPYFDVHFNSGRRIALAVTLEIEGAPVTLYAVHLDNRLGVGDRREQMLPVLKHAQQQTTPVIIAGDFNTSPFTWISHVVPVLTTTQDDRFEQLARDHGFATPVTSSGPTHRYIGMKLDGIYTRGFDTLKFATADAKNVSDHLALWATLRRTTVN